MDGWMGEWMVRWMDGWMDGYWIEMNFHCDHHGDLEISETYLNITICASFNLIYCTWSFETCYNCTFYGRILLLLLLTDIPLLYNIARATIIPNTTVPPAPRRFTFLSVTPLISYHLISTTEFFLQIACFGTWPHFEVDCEENIKDASTKPQH